MQWVSCASSRLTVWLQGLKVRHLSSTPVSRAILETSCSGIRLQTWRKRLNRQRVGLIVFFFFIPAVWQVQNVKQRWTPSFGQENAEIKLGSQALLD